MADALLYNLSSDIWSGGRDKHEASSVMADALLCNSPSDIWSGGCDNAISTEAHKLWADVNNKPFPRELVYPGMSHIYVLNIWILAGH